MLYYSHVKQIKANSYIKLDNNNTNNNNTNNNNTLTTIHNNYTSDTKEFKFWSKPFIRQFWFLQRACWVLDFSVILCVN